MSIIEKTGELIESARAVDESRRETFLDLRVTEHANSVKLFLNNRIKEDKVSLAKLIKEHKDRRNGRLALTQSRSTDTLDDLNSVDTEKYLAKRVAYDHVVGAAMAIISGRRDGIVSLSAGTVLFATADNELRRLFEDLSSALTEEYSIFPQDLFNDDQYAGWTRPEAQADCGPVVPSGEDVITIQSPFVATAVTRSYSLGDDGSIRAVQYCFEHSYNTDFPAF